MYPRTVDKMPAYVDEFSEERWEKVKGYNKLSDGEKQLLRSVYLRHMNGMGREKRLNFYGHTKIKKIERDLENRSINIFFKEGTWWHYDTRGSWW